MSHNLSHINRPQRATVHSLVALILIASPYIFVTAAGFAQTRPPQSSNAPVSPSNLSAEQVAPDAQATQPTAEKMTNAWQDTTMVTQAAEQNKDGVITNVSNQLMGRMGQFNEVYYGLDQFWSYDIVSNLFANIGQLIGKWITEFIDGWVSDTVQFLTGFLRIFVLNPNIAVNGLGGSQPDNISPLIRQAADIMYGIAVDLLLLLFILCIWKYWAEAAWRGGGNLMGAVGRLIFTAGLMLAWPTIYAFEIQITNEMIKAIYFNSADQVAMLDVAMASAVKAGLMATSAGLAHAFAPVIFAAAGGAAGTGAGGLVLGTVGDIVSFAGLIIYTILGIILIAELIYIIVLKAVQTALLVAQYMFAPIFLVFFATPDTESVTSGYVKAWVEVSLWTFVWVGLLRIMDIMLYSDFNPWGKILMAVGILQIMIQVPSFLARAQISPMSDFISAGLISGFALNGLKNLGMAAHKRTAQLFDYMFNQQYAARGMAQSQTTALGGIPTQAADPQLLTQIRDAATGKSITGKGSALGKPPGVRGDVAHALASPGLDTTGAAGKPEKEEEKKARLARQAQLDANYASVLAASGAGAAMPAGFSPLAALARLNAQPGARNTLAAAAQVFSGAALAQALSGAGVARGLSDPLTAQSLRSLQSGPGAGMEGQINDEFQHGEMESGVFNPLDNYNHANYKFVQAKIAAVDARTYNGNSIGYAANGQGNQLVGDGRGNLRHMRVRKGASPEEVAHLVLAGGFTELFKDDAEAFDAARQSAIDAGEDAPKGLMERMGAGVLAYSGHSFKQTARAKERFGKALFKHAALGSEAYVSGNPGNAYSHYLTSRFGDWSAKDDTWGVHIMTDSASPESPWNPKYGPATDMCVQAGLPLTEANRAAGANSYVQKLPAWQRRQGLVAVSSYLKQMADAQHPGVDEIVKNAAIGRLSSQLSRPEVEAAYAIQVESNGADLSLPIVQTVAHLSNDPLCKDSTSAYRGLRTLVAQSTGLAANRASGYMTITAMLQQSTPAAPPAEPTGAVHIPAGGYSQPEQIVLDENIVIQPVDTAVNLPPQSSTVDVSGAGSPGAHVAINTRMAGGGGSDVVTGNVNVEARSTAAGAPVPDISQGEIAGALHNAGINTRPLYVAAQMMIDMLNAGFSNQQIQDQRIAGIANHYYSNGQPHMLNTVAVAANVLGNSDINVGSVQTIQTMIDAGYNPNQIQRPDVWTAEALMSEGLSPTPAQIRRWRLDDRFVPHQGMRLPPGWSLDPPDSPRGRNFGPGRRN